MLHDASLDLGDTVQLKNIMYFDFFFFDRGHPVV